MSSTTIPVKVRILLAARAAGRCEYRGCNRVLTADELTRMAMNTSCFAHIVADSKDGPRGDPVRSPLLAKEIANLMLVCATHHKLIDVDDEAGHPETLLLEFKGEHEERIARLTDIQGEHRTRIVIFGARIGDRPALPSVRAAQAAVLPMYPADDGTRIDLGQLGLRDDDPDFVGTAARIIRERVRELRTDQALRAAPEHISLFGLGPIALLMALGEALGNVGTVDVYNLRRPGIWAWGEERPPESAVVVERPAETAQRDVAIAFSVSGVVQEGEITTAVRERPFDPYRLRIEAPRLDAVVTREQLAELRDAWRALLQDIRRDHGAECIVHLFPAVPVALAVECGRALLPKSDPEIRIYDRQNHRGGFVHVLTLFERARA